MLHLIPAVALVLAQAPAPPDKDDKSPAEIAAIADRLAPSLVRVEITPQYDKGESPASDPWAAWRAFAAAFTDEARAGQEDWDQLVKEERPGERGGFMIAPDRVFTTDPNLHPRFIKSIRVRFNDQVVDATPAAWPVDRGGLILQLADPLDGAIPVPLDPEKEGPYLIASYEKRDAVWSVRIGGLRSGVVVAEDGRRFTPGGPGALVLAEDGTPVAFSGGDFSIDGSWKAAISDWPVVTHDRMTAMLDRLAAESAAHLPRVTVNFRSPRNAGERGFRGMGFGDERPTDITEWNGLGLIVDPETIIVLGNFEPRLTARLERIRVFPPSGEPIEAAFTGTLKDWGAFVARLERPAPSPARLASGPITDQRGRLLLQSSVTVRGETRTAHLSHARINAFYTSWKGRTFPQIDAGGANPYARYGGGESDYVNFLYDLDGALVAVPLQRREKVTVRDRWGSDTRFIMTPVALLSAVLGEKETAFDTENRPLSEEEENRLAWLGVEMQPMDAELARASGVMEETRGGQSGGIVTYLYPNSPAAEAGIKDGDIILRLHVEGHPRPLEVEIEDSPGFGMMDQFWAALDRVPEEYFDRLPLPWGSAENSLTRALTDLGFGTPFVAEVWREGQVMQIPMQITQGPAHYDAAARYKSEPAGLTVRQLTYEVRRYLQMAPDEPGVIIGKVEPGSKAAIAGLKPFEVIRTINDEPVNSVKDFERLIAPGGELRFAVKRMTQGRTVKIRLEPTNAPN